MRSTLLIPFLLTAACGGAPKPDVVSNEHPPGEPAASKALACDGAMQSGYGGLHGITTSKKDGTPLSGVTVVASSPALQGEQTAISDEHGCYFMMGPPGDFKVTYYYGSGQGDQTVTVTAGVLGEANFQILEPEGSDVVKITADPPPPPSK